ncbi:MAG: P-loop NTPase [bacterium]|nr:P-loop NTPase [bacterium]
MNIAISSGKGGTGKTFVATNIAIAFSKKGKKVCYLDCDVEEPNGHLFLKPRIDREEDISLLAPVGVDNEKCIKCGKCQDACRYNAIAVIKDKVLFFPQLCHVCGACKIVCPEDAIIEKDKKIGVLKHGKSGTIDFHYALLETGEGGMSPRLIKRVKECAGNGINILDSSPGTACPVVETVKDVDLCVLVTDPTPFGVNDLKLAVDMCRKINREPVVLVNRAEYMNDNLKKYCKEQQLELIGEIPDDRRIAEVYSVGDIVVEKLPQYKKLFEDIAERIEKLAQKKRVVKKIRLSVEKEEEKTDDKKTEKAKPASFSAANKPKELVIISGKGGTGKTSLAASFVALAKKTIISDCDVDAADLHLLLAPQIKKRGNFSGGVTAEIDPEKCTGCNRCKDACRFFAIESYNSESGKELCRIDPVACEGCGVCYLVCKDSAVKVEDAINGEWFVSETRFGPMTHAKLGVAEENSGRLVTLVRNKAAESAAEVEENKLIIDGAPGTGCPVIASITGSDYALIVTEPTVSGIHDMKRILDVTRHFGVTSGIVVNKYDLNIDMTEKIKNIAKDYDSEFIGTIPYDKRVTEAQMKALSIIEYTEDGAVVKSIKQIWKKINSIININQ